MTVAVEVNLEGVSLPLQDPPRIDQEILHVFNIPVFGEVFGAAFRFVFSCLLGKSFPCLLGQVIDESPYPSVDAAADQSVAPRAGGSVFTTLPS